MLTYLTYSLLGITAVVAALSLFANKKPEKDEKFGPISSYLLAGRSLGRVSVVSLLMSSSFSLNALFYAAWIGYTIGAWALIIQFAWSACYFWLAWYTNRIRLSKSIHDFLFTNFGAATRIVAGLLSLIGMMCQIGWESEIAASTFGTLVGTDVARSAQSAIAAGAIVAGGVVASCLFYTVIGGLRGNAIADKVLNIIKLVCLLIIIVFLGVHTSASIGDFVPKWTTVAAKMGGFAFTTNVVFNLLWQFVDASSWQSIIAGKQVKEDDMANNLKASGIAIFIVPGIIGTILGIVTHGLTDVSDNNVIARIAVTAFGWWSPLGAICALLMIAAVMSLLDGLFLACAYTLVVDVFFPREKLPAIEENTVRAESILAWIRVSLILIAIISAVGVHFLVEHWHLDLFSFVYVLIISQLCLFGPVILGLTSNRVPRSPMWLVLIASFVIGMLSAWWGTHGGDSRWSDAAGSITAIVSTLFALINSKPKASNGEPGLKPAESK